MKAFTWVPNFRALQVACSKSGPIPILQPLEASRFLRWRQILSWYGSHSISDPPVASEKATTTLAFESQDLSGHIIAALDDEVVIPAAVLAALDGRPLIRSQLSELSVRVSESHARSLLIFAHPSQLKNRDLLKLSESLSLPWGIITGRDLAALSFAVAKLIAARRPSRLPRFHLDAIARQKWHWPQNDRLASPDTDCETTLETLRVSDWDTISIHCHGDGAHANFNSVVLCGVADKEELGIGGWVAGCAVSNGSSRCKRVHHKKKRSFRFGDLRARRVCLFTCNGFSVAGDVYPSDASFVLSAIEGYASALLTTDRRLRFESWLFQAVPELLAEQDSLSLLSTVLNDLNAFTEGARPYVLYGDPAYADPPERQIHKSNSKRQDQPFSGIAELGEMANFKLLGVNKRRADLIFQRGAKGALLISRDKSSELNVTNRSEDLNRVKAWFVGVGKRVQRAKRIESAIRHYHEARFASAGAAAEAQAELRAILERLEESIDEGGRLISEMERTGVWFPAVETWRSHVLLLTNLWDIQFAGQLDDYLLEGDLHLILRDGFFLTLRAKGPRCPRCGCTLTKGVAHAPLLGGVRHQWLDCPTCGPREARDIGVPRLSAVIPEAALPGDSISISVRCVQRFRSPLDESGLGLLVTHLKDSGRGRVSHRAIDQVRGQTHSLKIPFSVDSALEIHTLRFALVRDLNVSYLRLRIPCIGSAL